MDSNNISNNNYEESKNNKSGLNDIKSDYFLKKTFDILPINKFLQIIKCNKKIKKRLNIAVNDYKEYSEIYSTIIIEMKIKSINDEFDKFINIPNDEMKPYFHIFDYDTKKEINIDDLSKNKDLTRIEINIDYQVKSFENLFRDCELIESIYFKKFYRNNINNMSNMFSGCSSLKELNISNFITINVTDMNNMFSLCQSLKEINLSNINTNKVTDMNSMFFSCSSLKELNLDMFNTNNVIKYVF